MRYAASRPTACPSAKEASCAATPAKEADRAIPWNATPKQA